MPKVHHMNPSDRVGVDNFHSHRWIDRVCAASAGLRASRVSIQASLLDLVREAGYS